MTAEQMCQRYSQWAGFGPLGPITWLTVLPLGLTLDWQDRYGMPQTSPHVHVARMCSSGPKHCTWHAGQSRICWTKFVGSGPMCAWMLEPVHEVNVGSGIDLNIMPHGWSVGWIWPTGWPLHTQPVHGLGIVWYLCTNAMKKCYTTWTNIHIFMILLGYTSGSEIFFHFSHICCIYIIMLEISLQWIL